MSSKRIDSTILRGDFVRVTLEATVAISGGDNGLSYVVFPAGYGYEQFGVWLPSNALERVEKGPQSGS